VSKKGCSFSKAVVHVSALARTWERRVRHWTSDAAAAAAAAPTQ